MGKVTELKETEFTSAVSSGVVLVDFWAPWCGPCRSFLVILDQLAEALPEVKVCKVNVDDCPALAAQFEVQTVPTLVAFKDGQVVRRWVGLHPKAVLLDALQNV
ncbi:MAG: thioredoxin [Lentisphaeria bacterium]|nr:thioredoxin [Lentisphaeria bacterium]